MVLLLFGVSAVHAQPDNVVREDTLEGVTVMSRTAQRRLDEVQVGVERIDIVTLNKTPALFGERDITRSLQLLPGVKSESEASSGYEVRGGTSAQNLILLDGATIYNAGHLMGLISTFNDNALNNAALYKGLVPANYGGATSSVFDISTRVGDMSKFHFNGSIGLLSTNVSAEGPIQKEKSSFLFAGRRSYLDLFLKATKDYKDNTLNFYDANLQLTFRLSPRDRLSFTFFRGRDNMGIEDLMDMKWSNTTANASWLHNANSHLYAHTQLTYSEFADNVGIDMMNIYYTMKGFIRHLTFHHDQRWMPSKKFTLRYGLESTYLQLLSAEWDINLLHQREKRDGWSNALWVSQELNINDRFTLSAGLRLRLHSVLGGAPYYEVSPDGNITNTTTPEKWHVVKTYYNLEPRLSGNVKLSPHHSLKIGYSRSTQDIHAIRAGSMSMPFDRYAMTSNLLKPETADQVAMGWTGIIGDGDYDFSAEGYYKWVKDIYDYRDGKSFYSEIEIERLLLGGNGRAYGLEFCAHKNKGKLTGWLSYTLSWSQNKIAGINNGDWYTASNDRRHDISVIGIYKANDLWEFTAMWHYNTGQALTAPSAKYEIDGRTFYYYAERNGYRAPASHRLDLGATHTKKWRRSTHVWAFGTYNTYNRYNPLVIRFENDDDKPSGTKATLFAMFGIVPYVSFTVKY
ncbi:MAG: TonB-dependent receptor plug domain-containing protein [Prevotella sp.]|nr:TonB-dependent receptor plug domain-containing protein [Prevotella sp.]